MLVSNHISWLDIPMLHAARHCRFISKSDVKGWPIIGTLATAAGTLYIQRSSRRDAMRMVGAMEEAFKRGEILAVFPEGTTGDGRELLSFHSNLLEAAVQCDAPVQPVGLSFVDGRTGEVSYAATYVGDETLLGSIWRVLSSDQLMAVVHYGQAQQPRGATAGPGPRICMPRSIACAKAESDWTQTRVGCADARQSPALSR